MGLSFCFEVLSISLLQEDLTCVLASSGLHVGFLPKHSALGELRCWNLNPRKRPATGNPMLLFECLGVGSSTVHLPPCSLCRHQGTSVFLGWEHKHQRHCSPLRALGGCTLVAFSGPASVWAQGIADVVADCWLRVHGC